MVNSGDMPNGLALKRQPASCTALERCGAFGCAGALRPHARKALASAVAALALIAVLVTSAFAVNAVHPGTAYATGSTEAAQQLSVASAQDAGTTLELYKNHADDSTPFAAGNMLPGDVETKSFFLRVSYQGSVTVKFHADIRDGHDGLADVLKCRVSIRGGEELYDGLMRDMPAALEYTLPQSEGTTEEVVYDISAYLETSVDNTYAEKELLADFRWWVESDGSGGGSGDGGSSSGSGDGSTDGISQGGLITPATGDSMSVALWTAIACILILAFALLFYAWKRKGEAAAAAQAGAHVAADGALAPADLAAGSSEKTRKRLVVSAAIAVALAFCLCAVTYALTTASETLSNNSFQTGRVQINLNDGEPVIQAQKFEPGMVVNREFFVENTGTADAFCTVSFTDVQGGLADVLIVRIADGTDTLFEGTPAELSSGATQAMQLVAGEKRSLTITFHYPKAADSSGQGEELSFAMSARATQVKNNPNGLFE